jgi:hypothetical protein
MLPDELCEGFGIDDWLVIVQHMIIHDINDICPCRQEGIGQCRIYPTPQHYGAQAGAGAAVGL